MRSWIAAVVGALVAALLIGAVAYGLSKAGRVDDLEGELDDVAAVRMVAAAFGEAYLTYDSADVAASSERVLALATPAFAEDFQATRVPGIEDLFADIQTSTDATTTDVFVGDVAGGQARALVVVDVAADSTATGPRTLQDLSFVVELVETDGSWLVDSVGPAPTPDVTGNEGSTTTTAPAPSTTG